MRSFVILLVVIVTTLALKHESLQVKISQSAVSYINTELRNVIPTIENEIQDFPLPDVSGNDFKLTNLKLRSADIGSSSINFYDNGLRFKLDDNAFEFGANFWVRRIISVTGKAVIRARGFSIDTVLSFADDEFRSVRINYCRVQIRDLDINLYNPILNFILNVMSGGIVGAARSAICNTIRDSAIPAINNKLGNLPEKHELGTIKLLFKLGSANVNADRFLSSYYAEFQNVKHDQSWDITEREIAGEMSDGQCCVWLTDYLLNTALATLSPPGALKSNMDMASIAGLVSPFNISVVNSGRPELTLTEKRVFLGAPVNVSLIGMEEGKSVNLGQYTTKFYFQSGTDIEPLELIRKVRHDLGIDVSPYLSTECRDYHRRCGEWTRRGECRRNPRYMEVYCRKSCGICEEDTDQDDGVKTVGPLEYILNNMIPTRDYVKFYGTSSTVLRGSLRTCGKFRPTEATRQIVHDFVRDFLRSYRA